MMFLNRTRAVKAEKLSQRPLFSSGQELANLGVSSGLLKLSWTKISELYREFNQGEQVRYRVYQDSNCTIIAFVTSPTWTEHHLQEEDLVPSTSLPLFHFLCSKRSSSFSIHKAAFTLFEYLLDQLSDIKTQFGNGTPLIITGHSLGGSVASLFTLWLLEGINRPGTKRPLCITFGSPLIGDKGLHEAISHSSLWSSCFLHVAANRDLVPRLFITPHNPNAMEIDSQTGAYKPFGTFLLCSESGCTCVEDPEAVSELLEAMGLETARVQNPNEKWQIFDYGRVVDDLMSNVMVQGISQLGELTVGTIQAGIVLQMAAIGVTRIQQNSSRNELVAKWERREKDSLLKKKMVFDPSKKLNDIKINMANLEWYKKDCKSDKKGYYDSYKNRGSLQKDIEVVKFKKYLNNYWEKMVAEAERIPQTEEAAFRIRWLYGGTNYRRMVEPLDIADYYNKGLRDYMTEGRSQHYISLEKWLEEAGKSKSGPVSSKKQNVSAILTEDSSFWARVEEALILCKLLKSGTDREPTENNLREFEEYVMQQINNYAVSPEIFLEGSSFMKWWGEYKEIMGTSYSSQLTDFIKNGKYNQYADGCP